jgi:hypothetical protein
MSRSVEHLLVDRCAYLDGALGLQHDLAPGRRFRWMARPLELKIPRRTRLLSWQQATFSPRAKSTSFVSETQMPPTPLPYVVENSTIPQFIPRSDDVFLALTRLFSPRKPTTESDYCTVLPQ